MIRVFLLLSLVSWLCACAPSLRMLHRSNENFEHCYAIDADESTDDNARRACWSDWLANHSEGQTPERIQYARNHRDGRVARDPSTSPLQTAAVAPASIATSAVTPVPATAPTSGSEVEATASDSNTPTDTAAAAVVNGEVPARTAAPIPNTPPRGSNPACASVCDPHYTACVHRCSEGRVELCQNACNAEHRTCSAGCF